ncbi:MAG: electron transport complex subunit RsxC [Oscillospiraceae bacterium]|nr:electron transport complex subunit RsxC [Oscillospiraceae bacterium]
MALQKHIGGFSIPHRKWTSESAIVQMGVPRRVVIPMRQHIGAPCEPLVKRGDQVKVGQMIGDTGAYVSAPVHASVSGTVANVVQAPNPGGGRMTSVEITSDGLQEIHESVFPKGASFSGADGKKEFLAHVRASGLVGLGGAGFPTHVKLNPPPGAVFDCLLINGAECEPYISSDNRLLLERAESIIGGVGLVLDALDIPKAYIGIESNKQSAIALARKLVAGDSRIDVKPLPTIYPQGAEKVLIYTCLGRRVPPGKLPADVGTVVLNVNSVSHIHKYITTGMPLISKVVTVSGSAVASPANVDVLIGTPLSEVFEFCGGLLDTARKIIMGGPMMGVAQYSLDVPVIKNTNALLAFDEAEAAQGKETACIRCGQCIGGCPMRLLPLNVNSAAVRNDVERMKKYHVMDCIECGSCEYKCPAKRRIVQSVRAGKDVLRSAEAAERAMEASRRQQGAS